MKNITRDFKGGMRLYITAADAFAHANTVCTSEPLYLTMNNIRSNLAQCSVQTLVDRTVTSSLRPRDDQWTGAIHPAVKQSHIHCKPI